jgi:hypothetical protein
MECRESAIHPARRRFEPWGHHGVARGEVRRVEGREMGVKLRNEPNFSAKKPMKVHKCPKKRTQFKAKRTQF